MLSRVAENLYWVGRYVERAENTARIVNVNAFLLLDLPKGTETGWQPLITITGDEEQFLARYEGYDERSVVRFLIGDAHNPGSMLSSLGAARENARTIRDMIPREAWEQINELYLYGRENLQSGVSKRGRYPYLRHIIAGAQTLTGMLAGTMNTGAGYSFLRIGRNLERADMTTRIIDVRSASLLPGETSGLRPFSNIQWMSVLKSITGYQMYRLKMQGRVRRSDVLRFLLQDDEFPRSFYHCIRQVRTAVAGLPRSAGPLRALGRLERESQRAELGELSQLALHELIDELQVGLGQVHDALADTYFLRPGTE